MTKPCANPLRILYMDNGPDSTTAFNLLEQAHFQFDILPHNPHHFWNAWGRTTAAPVLVASEGRFIGLAEIRRFIKVYTAV